LVERAAVKDKDQQLAVRDMAAGVVEKGMAQLAVKNMALPAVAVVEVALEMVEVALQAFQASLVGTNPLEEQVEVYQQPWQPSCFQKSPRKLFEVCHQDRAEEGAI